MFLDKIVTVSMIEGDLIFVNKHTNKIMFVLFDSNLWYEGSTLDGDGYLRLMGFTLDTLGAENIVHEDENVIIYHVEA